jgi:hypothetical protein
MQEVTEQIEEDEYSLSVAQAMKEALEASNSKFSALCKLHCSEGDSEGLWVAIDVLEDVSPHCTPSFPTDGPPCTWIITVLNKRLGLPVSDNAMHDDSDSDDEASISVEFCPLFWRLILADQRQGVRLEKGNSVEIPGVGTIPLTSFPWEVKSRSCSRLERQSRHSRIRLLSRRARRSHQKRALASR